MRPDWLLFSAIAVLFLWNGGHVLADWLDERRRRREMADDAIWNPHWPRH